MNNDVELWLVGSPDNRVTERVLLLASTEGVQDSIRVFPWMNKKNISNMIGAADVGIGPLSLDLEDMTEAQPLKIRLYLAIGLPILINHIDLGIDSNQPYIFYVPSHNSKVLAKGMDQLINQKGECKELAKLYAKEHLSWDAVAKETVEFMSQLIEKRDHV